MKRPHQFDFACPCGAEGKITIDLAEGMTPFGCPEECGSVFVPWQPDGVNWVLRCVVSVCYEPIR